MIRLTFGSMGPNSGVVKVILSDGSLSEEIYTGDESIHVLQLLVRALHNLQTTATPRQYTLETLTKAFLKHVEYHHDSVRWAESENAP